MSNEIQYLEAEIQTHEERIGYIMSDCNTKINKEQKAINSKKKRISNLIKKDV